MKHPEAFRHDARSTPSRPSVSPHLATPDNRRKSLQVPQAPEKPGERDGVRAPDTKTSGQDRPRAEKKLR